MGPTFNCFQETEYCCFCILVRSVLGVVDTINNIVPSVLYIVCGALLKALPRE